MNDDLEKMIRENNELLQEVLEVSKRNQKKIKKIHSYMRRSFVAKIMYWGIIILVAAGAFYAIKPRVENVIEKYNNLQDQLDKTTNAISNPSSLIRGIIPKKDDIGILQGLFNS